MDYDQCILIKFVHFFSAGYLFVFVVIMIDGNAKLNH